MRAGRGVAIAENWIRRSSKSFTGLTKMEAPTFGSIEPESTVFKATLRPFQMGERSLECRNEAVRIEIFSHPLRITPIKVGKAAVVGTPKTQ
jgi:hypothetical protein